MIVRMTLHMDGLQHVLILLLITVFSTETKILNGPNMVFYFSPGKVALLIFKKDFARSDKKLDAPGKPTSSEYRSPFFSATSIQRYIACEDKGFIQLSLLIVTDGSI